MNLDPQSLPVRVDFVAYRGDDWTRMFEPMYLDSVTGQMTPLDMTGWDGRMQVRQTTADGGTVLLSLTRYQGNLILGPQSGGGRTWQLLVYIPRVLMNTLPPGLVASYDIELKKPDGKVQTFYYGDFCVEGDITKGGTF